MLNMRRSCDRLIFNMRIPYLGKIHHFIETGPRKFARSTMLLMMKKEVKRIPSQHRPVFQIQISNLNKFYCHIHDTQYNFNKGQLKETIVRNTNIFQHLPTLTTWQRGQETLSGLWAPYLLIYGAVCIWCRKRKVLITIDNVIPYLEDTL